ncbi:MAG: SRPBCC family protein [Verrucomicrobiales bacterium]
MTRKSLLLGSILLCSSPGSRAEEQASFREDQWDELRRGEIVVLDERPDDGEDRDGRFVTCAALIEAPRREVWEVVNDKEHAADFVDGVLESRVLERTDDRILVEQATKVGGPKEFYRYRLRHRLHPIDRADFSYAGGDLKDVEGSWWFFEGKEPETCLLVYSLRIDAGFFAPGFVVRPGMRKSMPGTLRSIRKEVLRRQAGD